MVAAAGIVVFNISPFLNWVNPEDGADPRTGYETDSLVPFIVYLESVCSSRWSLPRSGHAEASIGV